jgi:hypothetical protein
MEKTASTAASRKIITLALQGGGSHGAFTWGFAAGFEPHAASAAKSSRVHRANPLAPRTLRLKGA